MSPDFAQDFQQYSGTVLPATPSVLFRLPLIPSLSDRSFWIFGGPFALNAPATAIWFVRGLIEFSLNKDILFSFPFRFGNQGVSGLGGTVSPPPDLTFVASGQQPGLRLSVSPTLANAIPLDAHAMRINIAADEAAYRLLEYSGNGDAATLMLLGLRVLSNRRS